MPYKEHPRQLACQLWWQNERRAEWVRAHGPCARCGSWLDLEVDHRERQNKVLSVSTIWGMSDDNPRRIAELSKCWVLCRKCHRLKTNYELRVHYYIKNAVDRHTRGWSKRGSRGS